MNDEIIKSIRSIYSLEWIFLSRARLTRKKKKRKKRIVFVQLHIDRNASFANTIRNPISTNRETSSFIIVVSEKNRDSRLDRSREIHSYFALHADLHYYLLIFDPFTIIATMRHWLVIWRKRRAVGRFGIDGRKISHTEPRAGWEGIERRGKNEWRIVRGRIARRISSMADRDHGVSVPRLDVYT